MKNSLLFFALFVTFSSFSQHQISDHQQDEKTISKDSKSGELKQSFKHSLETVFDKNYGLYHKRFEMEYPLLKDREQKDLKSTAIRSSVPLGPVTLADSMALVEIYNALTGSGWNDNTNWLQPGQNVETWFGVTVTGNRVTELNLPFNNLFGILPAEIGDLDQLTSLVLNDNSIFDVIPTEIGNLGSLVTLNIGVNQLVGEIPATFSSLISLEYLDLADNFLSEGILNVTGNTSLTSLFLNNNDFYGSIPGELEFLSNLENLDLSFNALEGGIPVNIGNMTELRSFRVSYNVLSGELPPELSNASNLESLYLDNNSFFGSIPIEYSNLTQLQSFDIRYNQFTGSFPEALLNIPFIQGIFLSGNQFNGSIPDLTGLANLQFLIIDGNQFTGAIPTSLGDLSNLIWLNIGGNQLEGTIPPELGNLNNLQLLRIWTMPAISGEIPTELGNLTNLIEIDLAFNSLSGSIPSELGSLSNLQILWLQGNELSGPVPSTFTGLTSLNQFSIRDNSISGLPDLTSLSLSEFDVSLNLIPESELTLNASVITQNIGQKRATIESDSLALVALYEFTNGDDWNDNTDWLQGPVYDWFGITSADGRVIEIQLSGNNLRPSFDAPEFFPDELADLTELTILNLSGNFLGSGVARKFPDAVYTSSNLLEILLNGCSLGGELPANAFPNAFFIDLSSNRFEGSIDFLPNTNTFINYCSVLGNTFSDLPDLTGISIDFLDVQFNNLTFEDLEPNIGIPSSFSYATQNIYGTDSIIYDLAVPLDLDFTVGGSANQYQWLLDGDTLIGETLPTLTINPGENGDYQLRVSSSLVADLILESGRYRITTAPLFNQTPSNIFHSYQINKTDGASIRSSVNAGDMNGDGIDDIAVANSTSIDIYFGDRLLSGNDPDITIDLTGDEVVGVLTSGFFNDDGFSDVVFSKFVNDDEDNTNALVVLEGANGLTQANLVSEELTFAGAAGDFGLAAFDSPLNVVNVGDLNNDGFDEAGVSTGGFGSAGSNIIVYFGGQETYDALPDIITPPLSGSFAYKMFRLGDVNGDNIDDFGVVNPNFNGNPEIYAIYFGAAGQTDFETADLLVDFTNSPFNNGQRFLWVSTTADVNGDSFSDILFRHFNNNDPNFPQEGTESLHVIYGGPSMDNLIDDAFLLPGNSEDLRNIDRFGGSHTMNVGDYDQDGEDDILITSFSNSANGHMFSADNLSINSIPEKIINAADETRNLGPGNNFVSYQTTNAFGDFNDNGLIDVMLTQPTEDGYNMYFYENFEPPGDLFYDSIALVDLYISTGGDNWTENGNWLTGNIDSWQRISLTTSRVTEIDLSNNGLVGDLSVSFDKLQNLEVLDLSGNELSGSLSNSINELPNLTTLNLSSNELTTIPDFNNSIASGLNTIDISANRLTFDDLEPVVNLPSVIYSDQKNIKLNQSDTVLVPVGRDQIISVSTGGTDNTYQWRFEGNDIAGSDATNTSFTVEDIERSNMGPYSVSVQNSNVPGLTIFSDPIDVLATAIVTVNVTDFDSNLIAENVSGSLMQTVRGDRGYDTLTNTNDVSSSFSFEPAILKGYLVGVTSDLEKYVDTYYENVFLWEEADTLELFNDTTIQIAITSVPEELTAADGEGEVSGSIEEDFDEDEARVSARRRASKRKCGLRRKRTGGRPGQDDDFELIAYGETDENGEFKFGFLPQGTYRFFVEYPGIPLDESSFVQFDIGEAGVSDDSFVLAAIVTEDGIVVELILGITSEYFTDFNIYPNPTISTLNIEYDKILSESITMDLVDMNGKVLITRELKQSENGQLEIIMDEYKSGLYILKFFDNQKNKTALTFRVIKK